MKALRHKLSNILPREELPYVLALAGIVLLGLFLRLSFPLHDRSIGEIDVYSWGVRTQLIEQHGLVAAGSQSVFPLFMVLVHRLSGAELYNVFLWAGPCISGILPPIFLYAFTRSLMKSRFAGLLAALLYSLVPIVFYRGTFTVSESLAYVFIPLVLWLSIKLMRQPSLPTYLALLVSFYLALNEHDSAKLLVLPVALAMGTYFLKTWRTPKGRIVFGSTIIVGAIVLFRDKTFLDSILFFFRTDASAKNAAFSDYPITTLGEYRAAFPFTILFAAAFGFGALVAKWKHSWSGLMLLSLYAAPILYYQQIQPRLESYSLVPFRLTPLLTFAVVPLAAAGITWIIQTKAVRPTIRRFAALAFLLPLIFLHLSPTTYPLSFVSSQEEFSSLERLPITQDDYIITQLGNIGMTEMATKTTNNNYFADPSGRVLALPNAVSIIKVIAAIEQETNRTVTGVLISKWKLLHRDPTYGWWDSFVVPQTNIAGFRNRKFTVRYEDDNVVLFGFSDRVGLR